MPHTSHKKKKQQQQQQQRLSSRNKRGEIELNDGWTQIARSAKALTMNPLREKKQPRYRAIAPDDPNYDPDLDEGHTRLIMDFTPAELPDGATLEKALSHYQKCETEWKQSNSWTELNKTFQSRVFKQDLNITNCICFGLSSPTGFVGSGVDRRNVAMYQLAAFKSVIDIIRGKQDQRPEAFTQEPLFNTLDVTLLSHLNIKVVEHPEAFKLITSNTFAFCPCAEQYVVRGALFRFPAIYMGSGALETFRDPGTGSLHSPHIGSTFIDDEEQHNAFLLEDTDKLENPKDVREHYLRENKKWHDEWRIKEEERAKADAIKGAGILHRFKQDKESVRLPDFEDNDHAFFNVHLFWRSSHAKADD